MTEIQPTAILQGGPYGEIILIIIVVNLAQGFFETPYGGTVF